MSKMFRHFTRITSRVVHGASYPDPKGVEYILEPDTQDEALGRYTRAALAASRFITPDLPEYQAIIRQYLDPDFDRIHHQKLLHIAGVKTLRTLYSGSKFVNANLRDSTISLTPLRRKGYGAWGGIRGMAPITLPETVSDLDLGQAVRAALDKSF